MAVLPATIHGMLCVATKTPSVRTSITQHMLRRLYNTDTVLQLRQLIATPDYTVCQILEMHMAQKRIRAQAKKE